MSEYRKHEQRPWTDEDRAEIARRWNAGESSSQIARHFGVTRNAIIGQKQRHCARFGIDMQRGAASAPKKVAPPKAPPVKRSPNCNAGLAFRTRKLAIVPDTQPTEVDQRSLRTIPLTCEPVDLEALQRHHCRYPVAEINGAHLFCGAARMEPLPYCASHAALCFVAPKPRQTVTEWNATPSRRRRRA